MQQLNIQPPSWQQEHLAHWLQQLMARPGVENANLEEGADRLQLRFRCADTVWLLFIELTCEAAWVEPERPASQAAWKQLQSCLETAQQ